MKLYWATTTDGYEDWFVVAKSKKEAAEFHEYAEGFDPEYANAKLICSIPKELIEKYKINEANWPSLELIGELGGKIISDANPRRVNFNGKIYKEGTFTESIFFDSIVSDAGVYVLNIQKTDKYKIGISQNIRKRIKQFETGNPENIKVVFYVETAHYKSLEKKLHEIFKNDRIGGEWFLFDEERLEELETNLIYLQSKAPNDFKFYNVKALSIQGRVYD
jgi:hypothetical protein